MPPLKTDSRGASFDTAGTTTIGFEHVYVTSPADSAAKINKKLAAGLHIIFTPAIYMIDEPLLVQTSGQVVLGLGLATLVSAAQNTIFSIGDVDGVRLAGLLLQAGPPHPGSGAVAPSLVQWGMGTHAGSAKSPGMLHDIFMRVGGPDGMPGSPVAVTTMLMIRSGHVIGDNLWLWRADHTGKGTVSYESNRCDHGLLVEGDDVSMYGLAVEHAEKDLTVWSGERGRTFFYQSELPYGVTQAQFGDQGYAGYRVADGVQTHDARGVGVYAFFRDHNVSVASGIVCPPALESSFIAPLTVFLSGHGGIRHVINDKGNASMAPTTTVNYVCSSEPGNIV